MIETLLMHITDEKLDEFDYYTRIYSSFKKPMLTVVAQKKNPLINNNQLSNTLSTKIKKIFSSQSSKFNDISGKGTVKVQL